MQSNLAYSSDAQKCNHPILQTRPYALRNFCISRFGEPFIDRVLFVPVRLIQSSYLEQES